MKLFRSEKFAFYLIFSGLLILAISIFLFIHGETIDSSQEIDSGKFGQFGDIIGGVVGSIWALAGFILFYVALKDQKKDLAINRNALKKQIDEFKLQKIELELTREVFKEQSETMQTQRFENTFFNMLNVYHIIIENLEFQTSNGREVFEKKRQSIIREYRHYTKKEINKGKCNSIFTDCLADIGNYFDYIEKILNYIILHKPSNMENYVSIFKSMLTPKEKLVLYYYGFSVYGEQFKELNEKLEFLNDLSVNMFSDLPDEHKDQYNYRPIY